MDIDTKGSSCHHVKTVSLALSFRESRQSHKYNRRHILIQFSGHLVKFNKRIWMSLETKQGKGAHCQVLPLDFYFCLFAWSKCGLDSGPEALVGICSPLRSSPCVVTSWTPRVRRERAGLGSRSLISHETCAPSKTCLFSWDI